MPRKIVYPDWVRTQCPPGHSVKRKGDHYYLYKTQSVYVKGMTNPQPKSEYVGIITKEGIQYSTKKRVDQRQLVRWHEYGFSYVMEYLGNQALSGVFATEEMRRMVTLNIIAGYSEKSYLTAGVELTPAKEMGVCLCTQKKRIEEYAGKKIEDLLILRDIHLIEGKGIRMLTEPEHEASELLNELGVSLDV